MVKQIIILNDYRRGEAKFGTFFTYSYSYLNPHYSFLRVPKHRYTNTGHNEAKICKNGVVGTTCIGTPLTYTGTGYPLHTCTSTTQHVLVQPTGFFLEMFDFWHFHLFFIHHSSPICPISKTHHGIYPKQLQKWFRLNKNPFSSC